MPCNFTHFFFSGFIIAGGHGRSGSYLSSVEVFNPISGNSCSYGNLPRSNWAFVWCNDLLCGGAWGWFGGDVHRKSCAKFDGKDFKSTSVTLNKQMIYGACWARPSGEVVLLPSERKYTETVSADGSTSSLGKTLPYNTG